MERPTEVPLATDPLGEALHLMRLTGCVYARSILSAPWGVDLPPFEGHMMFHIITAGRCWLETDGSEPLLLERGSLALVPHGLGHRLVHEPGADAIDFFDLPIERVTERYELLEWGGGGEVCRLICVVVRFDHAAAEATRGALSPDFSPGSVPVRAIWFVVHEVVSFARSRICRVSPPGRYVEHRNSPKASDIVRHGPNGACWDGSW